jgi:hypothetical protein
MNGRGIRRLVWNGCREGKVLLIKDDMPSNVDSTRLNMETLVSKMILDIPNKNTRMRPEGKFGGIIWAKEGQHSQPKTFRNL